MLLSTIRMEPVVIVLAIVCFVAGVWLTLRDEARHHHDHNRLWR